MSDAGIFPVNDGLSLCRSREEGFLASLFAIAGGAPPAMEEYLAWGVALLIPVDYILTILAVYKNSLKISYFSIFITGVVFSLALLIGFTYEHSEDEDEVAKQSRLERLAP